MHIAVGLLIALRLLATEASSELIARLTNTQDWRQWRGPGNWEWRNGWVGGTGAGVWHYAERGSSKWKDYRIECDLRIDEKSTRLEPKWEARAGWPWAAYRNNSNAAGYEAGLVFRIHAADLCRVMFSAAFQDVVLWSAKGGFLQVTPCKIDVGKALHVQVHAQGPHITVAVDGTEVIDYWDRTLLTLAGKVGLALHEGAAFFSNARIVALLPFKGTLPRHDADLRFRDWRGACWAFDRQEPIFLAGDDCHGYEAKLVPGYKPQLTLYWYWINYRDDPFYADRQKSFNILAEGECLRFEVIATDNKDKTWLTGRTQVTVTYDAEHNRYVHDHVSDLIIPEGHTLRLGHPVEFTDPVIYGHVGSGSTQGEQWETPHPWSVYKHQTGAFCKLPPNHALWYPGYAQPAWHKAEGGYLDANSGFGALVGDPVANPIFILRDASPKDTEFHTELCGWAFDVHLRWYPVKPGGILQPGTYTVRWQLTSVDGKQRDEGLSHADFLAPEGLEKKLLVYTGGIGHLERFDKVVNWASPFYEYPWGDASLQDTTTGHKDRSSLRLSAQRSASSVVAGSVYQEAVLPDTRYEVSAWVKTESVKGERPGLRFGGHSYFPLITGTNDWRKIGFVCKPNEPLHTVPFSLVNSGSGTVLFDGFMIRPLGNEENCSPPLADSPKPIAHPNAAADMLLVWNARSVVGDPDRTLLDFSYHGSHGRLEEGAAVIDQNGTRVFATDGNKGHITTDKCFDFRPPQSFTIWVKPGNLSNEWNVIATGGAWNRAWMLFLFYRQSPYSIDFRAWGRRICVEQVVPKDKWTHIAIVDDGKAVRMYVNGMLTIEEPTDGASWCSIAGPLVLGSWLCYGIPSYGFNGCFSDCHLWNRA